MFEKKALKADHDARLISVKLVSVVRQKRKTDKNYVLDIVQTTLMLSLFAEKTVEQQQLQSTKCLRELVYINANQAIALIGVTPVNRDSGRYKDQLKIQREGLKKSR